MQYPKDLRQTINFTNVAGKPGTVTGVIATDDGKVVKVIMADGRPYFLLKNQITSVE